MTEQHGAAREATHDVFNQTPPWVDHNLYDCDRALQEAVAREGAAWAEPQIRRFGAEVGSASVQEWGEQANRHPPVLMTHDRYGRRVDKVEFHPAWHSLMALSVEHALHALPWRESRPGHAARAALFRLASENEFGHGCPLSMTCAAIPTLRSQPELALEWEPRLLSLKYDARFVPAVNKTGALFGMAMTEKQGGSDVRANTTRAAPLGPTGPGQEYALHGHKWFCSAPMSDGFFVLAQAPEGLSCFLLPRFLPDETQNQFRVVRLKDKLGNRSNASSEVEFDGAWARMVGEPGRGVATIVQMVNHTRLDCVAGSCALLRRALVLALHHARHRRTFGKLLSEHPLMQNVLADLALESEAASTLLMRLARAYDAARDDTGEARFRRLATSVAKYWVCKRAAGLVAEALECLGGNGYVEDFPLARLYREAPLNSIWEGSGNVVCLDALRAIKRQPETLDVVLSEIEAGAGAEPRLARHLQRLKAVLAGHELERAARRIVEALALGLQATLLVQHAPSEVADAFCASRLEGNWGYALGTLPEAVAFDPLIERALPS